MRRDQGRDPGADELERLLAERGNRLMGQVVVKPAYSTAQAELYEAAEDARFELARGCPQHAFQACALGH
jgi:hypothetical protein